MKIQKVLTHSLRNDAHFQFHSDFRDAVVKSGAAKHRRHSQPETAEEAAAAAQ
ncbi:MAG: hypothetical protein LBB56_08565 [Chitinispirillales bacterium]|jgi:hypothetical protein|nr:hypothetical protein [Chitinispirillales bacterium]